MRKTVLVTGSLGLIGSAIWDISRDCNYHFSFLTKADCNLMDAYAIKSLYHSYKPHYVIHAAAKTGGVAVNKAKQGEFFYDNLIINTQMLEYARLYGVEKFIAFSCLCAFPQDEPVFTESNMHNGKPFHGNFGYGYAKRMADIQIQAYKEQYNLQNYCTVIPGNVFGEHDDYNLETGHVIASLIHKIYLAKQDGTPIRVWGDGLTKREFIYSKDVAKYVMKILDMEQLPDRIIISADRQYSIKEIVEELCKIAGFQGEVVYETDKPKGKDAVRTDLSLLKSIFGELSYTELGVALKNSYEWFANNYQRARK
jgi:GDP-L-fucose synthase